MKSLNIIIILFVVMFSCVLSHAAVFFEDNYDGYSDSPNNHGWHMGANVSVQDGVGYLNTRGVKVVYNTSGTEPYWFGQDIESQNISEIYVSFRFKIENTPTGGVKFLKIFGKTFDPKGYANTTFGLDQSRGTFKEVAYGPGISVNNDTQVTAKFDGVCNEWDCDTNIVFEVTSDSFNGVDNGWHIYEGHVKFNSIGQRDGVIEVWIDGIQKLRATNVKNRNDANSHIISNVQLANYCGATWASTWYLYYDDVKFSTTPIGSVTPPPVGNVPPSVIRDFKKEVIE